MKEYLLNVLNEYLLLFPDEQVRQKKLSEFLLDHVEEEFTDWNNFDGHIVASGFVYSIKDKKFLVLYHKDLKKVNINKAKNSLQDPNWHISWLVSIIKGHILETVGG